MPQQQQQQRREQQQQNQGHHPDERYDYVDFDLSRASCPTRIWFSRGDWVAGEEDVRRIAAALPDCKSVREVPGGWFTTFGHQDFTWAKEASADLYKDILSTCFPEAWC